MKLNLSALPSTHLALAAIGVLAGAGLMIAGDPAAAQQREEVTIVAPRVVHQQIGRAASGAPIELISLTRVVSYADLDLTKQADVTEFEKRIKDTAKEACKQLDSLYPLTPSDPDCIRKAADGGMAQAKVAIAAAGK